MGQAIYPGKGPGTGGKETVNVAQLKHPRHLLADALDKRIEREEAHLERLKERAARRAALRANAAETGNPPPALPGPP